MEVHYDLTSEDYVRFNDYHCEHSPTVRRARVGSMLLGPVLFGLIGILEYSLKQRVSALIYFGAAGILWLAVFPRYWQWSIRRRARQLLAEGPNGEMVEHATIRIDGEGVHTSSRKGASTLKWTAIERIVESDSTAYFYMSAVSALMIPRRAFADPADYARFLAEARQLREAAVGLTAPDNPLLDKN